MFALISRRDPGAAALCSGSKGIHGGSRRPFTYKGTKFHRVVKSFMAQVSLPTSDAAA
jgi:cyclophilin family peptidyl-prolyl cis-trans isomerase